MGILGPSEGTQWLTYMGIPDHYPQFSDLTREIDDAMWEAAQDVLRERAAEDPLLRALADQRCGLWETHDRPAGDLPVGTEFAIETSDYYSGKQMRAYGEVRPLDEREQAQIDFRPDIYADLIGVTWTGRTGDLAWPTVFATTVVKAYLPIPFDLSALLLTLDAENNHPPRASRPRRAPKKTPSRARSAAARKDPS